MSNHFHLIASTPDANINEAMYYFMKNSSKRLTEAGNRINQTFSGRYYKTILQSYSYYLNAYKYIYRNPVKAGISTKVENYPYSTIHGLLGQSKLIVPLAEDQTLFSSIEETLKWLNTRPAKAKEEAVAYALRRPYFKPLKNKKDNKPILEPNEII